MSDIDFIFEGLNYQLRPLTEKGRRYMAAESLPEVIPTVNVNKIRDRMIAAGLTTLVNGNSYKDGYRLQSRAEEPGTRTRATRAASGTVSRILMKRDQSGKKPR